MKYFKASFSGRQNGAIGIYYHIDTIVNGTDQEQARINLYDRFEHIHLLDLVDITLNIKVSDHDKTICIRFYNERNGFHLFNNNTFKVDSPKELIKDEDTRELIFKEATTDKRSGFKS